MGVIVIGWQRFSYRQGLSFTGFISATVICLFGGNFSLFGNVARRTTLVKRLAFDPLLRMQTNQLQMSAPIHYAMPTFYGFFYCSHCEFIDCQSFDQKSVEDATKMGATLMLKSKTSLF